MDATNLWFQTLNLHRVGSDRSWTGCERAGWRQLSARSTTLPTPTCTPLVRSHRALSLLVRPQLATMLSWVSRRYYTSLVVSVLAGPMFWIL